MTVLNIKSHVGSVGEFAYQVLKNSILLLELEPGMKISEADIANKLEISRGPVREAIIRLTQEKLLKAIPKSGTIISKFDMNKIVEGIFIRRVLEEKIMSYALPKIQNEDILLLEKILEDSVNHINNIHEFMRLDQEFHYYFYALNQKHITWELISLFNHDYFRSRVLNTLQSCKMQKTFDEHHQILDAIKSKDLEKVLLCTNAHLQTTKEDLDILLKVYPHYFN